jgi:hypothetical protein
MTLCVSDGSGALPIFSIGKRERTARPPLAFFWLEEGTPK